MLKVVVFDGGYGGEFFADRMEQEIPILEVIRVIDWRNADKYLKNPKAARRIAKIALRPYIGNVDLIIFANYLLTITSLKHFKRKYKEQKFVGMDLKLPDTFIPRDTIILATKSVARTINYYNYIRRIKRKTQTLTLDSWPGKIDDGELTYREIKTTLGQFTEKNNLKPKEIILACSQFDDIKQELIKLYGKNLRIYDAFEDTLRKTCKALNIRGGIGKKTT